ncbi:MAG: cohesin domain-containing protein [Paludibacter sp.]|nr:cohesin domain-containing protein [Paludibacter sp.]
MMKENNLIKVLIPLVAVVVVFESIVLVTNLEKGTKVDSNSQVADSIENQIQEADSVELVFATDNQEMKVGKTYSVSLDMMGKESKNIDAIELYISFDPEMVNLTGLTFPNKNLPEPTFSKVSDVKNVIVVSYLISDVGGFVLNKDEVNSLVAFKVTPKKEGNISFGISTGDDDNQSTTMFVENSTGSSLGFSSNRLEISVVK